MSRVCECYARIHESDPRAEIWKEVFGELTFPLKYPIADIGFTGHPEIRCYPGDLSLLSEEQKEKLVDIMSTKFNVSKSVILADFEKGIIPIRSDNVTVSMCQIHFWNMVID